MEGKILLITFLSLLLFFSVYIYGSVLLHSILVTISQAQSGELGDVGDGGRLRCLHGKVDTTISCMCTYSVGSAQCSGCVVYGPGAMAAI